MSEIVKRKCLMLSDLQSGAEEIEYILASDHDAAIAAKDAQIERLRALHLDRTKLTTRMIAERDDLRERLAHLEFVCTRFRDMDRQEYERACKYAIDADRSKQE
jgi:hypothetical protein